MEAKRKTLKELGFKIYKKFDDKIIYKNKKSERTLIIDLDFKEVILDNTNYLYFEEIDAIQDEIVNIRLKNALEKQKTEEL